MADTYILSQLPVGDLPKALLLDHFSELEYNGHARIIPEYRYLSNNILLDN